MESHSYLNEFSEEDLVSFENKEKIHRVGKIKSICQKSLDISKFEWSLISIQIR